MVNILLKLLAAITAAAQLGMDVTSIIAAVGTMGVAVGLAIKDSMSNVASGVQILFTHPFRAGDYLVTEGVEGTVERIEIMYTSLRTFDNKEVIIPNSGADHQYYYQFQRPENPPAGSELFGFLQHGFGPGTAGAGRSGGRQ